MSVPHLHSEGVIARLGPIDAPGVGKGTLAGPALAPAYVFRQDSGGGNLQYAVVLGEGLGRRALMDLLYALAPYKAHGPDRFGRVLDNWRLHDRAKTSAGSENLLDQHADSLKVSWQVFSSHRDVFIRVFEDETENTRVLPVVTWERSEGGVRRWHFDAIEHTLVQAIEESIPALGEARGSVAASADLPRGSAARRLQLDSLAGLVTIPYLLPKLQENWRPWQPLVKDGKSNYVGPASVPVVALMHRRAILNSDFVRAVEALDLKT